MNNPEHKKTAHYIHKTSYSFQERLVGAFVLSALLILLGMLYSLGTEQHFFDDSFILYGKLGSARGLSAETVVQVSGFDVGDVSSLEITDQNDILVTMKIYKRFHNLLREDSRARVGSLNIAGIGKSIIEFNAGSLNLPKLHEHSTIVIEESIAVEDLVAEVTDTLRIAKQTIVGASKLIAALDPYNFTKTFNRVSDTINVLDPEQLAQTLKAVNQLSSNLEDITGQISAGKGMIGAAIYDDRMRHNIQESAQHLSNAADSLDTLMATLRIDLEQSPELLEHIDQLMLEIDRTIRATQHMWPISTTLPEPGHKQTLVDPMPAND